MNVLVTGGAGYIGSHVCLELLEEGFDVLVLDNLANSSSVSIDLVSELAGRPVKFIKGDINDLEMLDDLFLKNKIDAVMHFAGLKAVGESVAKPLMYYKNNVCGTVGLLQTMQKFNVKIFVFSSSATVYGEPQSLPITEQNQRSALSPYGTSKLTIEKFLEDIFFSDKTWKIACLRYFNPVGAHSSGLIGEDPKSIPNNLMPFISQVACGVREKLTIFGGDYPTNDGTGVRDYIHVVDLAKGHIAALRFLSDVQDGKLLAVNLGTGVGTSVLEIVKVFEKVTGKIIPYEIVGRRPGDIAVCYADPKLAGIQLKWQAELGIEEMCADSWRWQFKNPLGYNR